MDVENARVPWEELPLFEDIRSGREVCERGAGSVRGQWDSSEVCGTEHLRWRWFYTKDSI